MWHARDPTICVMMPKLGLLAASLVVLVIYCNSSSKIGYIIAKTPEHTATNILGLIYHSCSSNKPTQKPHHCVVIHCITIVTVLLPKDDACTIEYGIGDKRAARCDEGF